MINFLKKNRLIIFIVLLTVFLGLFISTIATRNRVKIDKPYYDVISVSLYIHKYNDLPKNYITKDEAWRNFKDIPSRVLAGGYSYGGDNFDYQGIITSYTGTTTLKEADIYSDVDSLIEANNRGLERLVFSHNSRNIEVFYTKDHYLSFEKISFWKMQETSNILLIVLMSYSIFVFIPITYLIYRTTIDTFLNKLLNLAKAICKTIHSHDAL